MPIRQKNDNFGELRLVAGRVTYIPKVYVGDYIESGNNTDPRLIRQIRNTHCMDINDIRNFMKLTVLIYTTPRYKYCSENFRQVIYNLTKDRVSQWNSYVVAMQQLHSEHNLPERACECPMIAGGCVYRIMGAFIKSQLDIANDIEVPIVNLKKISDKNYEVVQSVIRVHNKAMDCHYTHDDDDENIRTRDQRYVDEIMLHYTEAFSEFLYSELNGMSYCSYLLGQRPSNEIKEYDVSSFNYVRSVMMRYIAANYTSWKDFNLYVKHAGYMQTKVDKGNYIKMEKIFKDVSVVVGDMSIKYNDLYEKFIPKLRERICEE